MLTTAADFHNARLFRVFAVLAAVFTSFLCRTIARRMSALRTLLVLRHTRPPYRSTFELMLELENGSVKAIWGRKSLVVQFRELRAQQAFVLCCLESGPLACLIGWDALRRQR